MPQLYGIDWDAPLPTGSEEAECVIVPDILNPLAAEQFGELEAIPQPTATDSDYGIRYFMQVVQFIEQRIQ